MTIVHCLSVGLQMVMANDCRLLLRMHINLKHALFVGRSNWGDCKWCCWFGPGFGGYRRGDWRGSWQGLNCTCGWDCCSTSRSSQEGEIKATHQGCRSWAWGKFNSHTFYILSKISLKEAKECKLCATFAGWGNRRGCRWRGRTWRNKGPTCQS